VGPDNSTTKYSGFRVEVSFEKPGVHRVTLTATDEHGESNQASLRIIAGNEPPVIDLKVGGNQTFFFDGSAVSYKVNVSDREDGSLASREIDAKSVAISIDYVTEGLRLTPVLLRQAALDSTTQFVVAQALINSSDCKTCHTRDVKTVGPAFRQIAEKYRAAPRMIDTLVNRIIRGSHGIWGTDNNMPAHPSIRKHDARTIVNYILSINKPSPKTRPVQGRIVFDVPPGDNGKGTYIIRAAYTDRGAESVPSHTTDSTLLLQSPRLFPLNADRIEGGALRDQLDEYVFLTTRHNSFIAWEDIDLTGVRRVSFRPNWHLYDIYPGGVIEVRIGSPDGELLGSANIEREQFNTRYRGAFGGLANMTEEQERRSKRYPRLDERKFFAPGSDKNSFTIPSVVELKPVEGKRDVYFVFKNESAAAGESLFPLAEIEMIDE
jgi:cytochrome c